MPSEQHNKLETFGKFLLLNSGFRPEEIATEVKLIIENRRLIVDVIGATGFSFEKNQVYNIQDFSGRVHIIECGNFDTAKCTFLRSIGVYVTHLPFSLFDQEGISIEVTEEIQKLRNENQRLKEEIVRGIARFRALQQRLRW